MSTQINLKSPYARKERFAHLEETVELISFFRMYNGASQSTTLDFDAAFNSARQRKVNGTRTQESVGDRAYKKLSAAKAEFRKACTYCEYRKSEACKTKQAMESVFWDMVENPKQRDRFRNRIKCNDVKYGLKSIPCKRLLAEKRIKNAEWQQ